MIEELRLVAELVGCALLWTEGRVTDVGGRIGEARGPTTRLESLRVAQVEHLVLVDMPLRTQGWREHAVILGLPARREVAARVVRVRERGGTAPVGERGPA